MQYIFKNEDIMNSELHLMIVWERAESVLERIIEDLQKDLEIIKMIKVIWDKERFSENLTRFYGTKLTKWSFKEKDCGNGPFTLIILEDKNPKYEYRHTSRGDDEYVNIHLFDRKKIYRNWFNKNTSRIHATNNPEETLHDLTLLLGMTPDEFIASKDNFPTEYKKNIVGADGWDSLDQLFKVLNSTIPYVVLRNFEYLPKQFRSAEHGDIDLLVNREDEVARIMNAKRVFRQKYRVHYACQIQNEKVLFDFRSVGDGYYCKEWEKEIMETRVAQKGFFIPNDENYKYSLLYHALIHKRKVSGEYRAKLTPYFGKDKYLETLTKFLKEKGYSFTEPVDYSVYFNTENANVEISNKRKQKIFQEKIYVKLLGKL